MVLRTRLLVFVSLVPMAGLLIAVTPLPAFAEDPRSGSVFSSGLTPGRYVRITCGTMRLNRATGHLISVGTDTLALRREQQTVRVPAARLNRLEIRTGRHAHVVQGIVIGGMVGLLAVVGASFAHTSGSLFADDTMVVAVVRTASIPAGFLIGGLTGALIRHDTWTEVPPWAWRRERFTGGRER